ncbi:MAG: hypothetical protein DCC55_40175 [Chloroflexi bacterium]|nr:MAG: hypothetical protein DCC55_40175 [Chloroflexota bacterium]
MAALLLPSGWLNTIAAQDDSSQELFSATLPLLTDASLFFATEDFASLLAAQLTKSGGLAHLMAPET